MCACCMCSPTIIIIYILDIRGTVGACPSSHSFLVPPQAEHSILQYVHGIFEREKGENRKEDDEAGSPIDCCTWLHKTLKA